MDSKVQALLRLLRNTDLQEHFPEVVNKSNILTYKNDISFILNNKNHYNKLLEDKAFRNNFLSLLNLTLIVSEMIDEDETKSKFKELLDNKEALEKIRKLNELESTPQISNQP